MNINNVKLGWKPNKNKAPSNFNQNALLFQNVAKNDTQKRSTETNSSALPGSSSSMPWGGINQTVLNTVSSSKSTSFTVSESKVILALTEGRGEASCEVGIAAIDLTSPCLILCQISDTQSYFHVLTKLNIVNPYEILIPKTFVESSMKNRLLKKITEQFPDIKITAMARSAFSKVNGIQCISKLCVPSMDSVILILQHKYYALAAASALLTYAELVYNVIYCNQTIKIEYQASENSTIIDITTADKLELVASACPEINKKYSCLYGVLNHCLTRIGARTLRAAILQPLCSVSDIEDRLNCISEFIQNSQLLAGIQAILIKLSNVDQLLSLATVMPNQAKEYSDRQLNYILLMKSVLEVISPLHDVLEEAQHPFLLLLREHLNDPAFEKMNTLLNTMIHADAHPAKGQGGIIQRCFAIKPEVDGLLDAVRKSYTDKIDEMRAHVRSLEQKYNLTLALNNTQMKGYHIIMRLKTRERCTIHTCDLPEEFIQVQRSANCFTIKTVELLNLSIRTEEILRDILHLSNMMIYKLLVEIKSHAGVFYTLCENIAKLDMLQSLAQTSFSTGYTRPHFNEFMEIKDARHPLLDYLAPQVTSNSMYASEYHNLHIITGPNGSGKSIYIRQLLLIQIMAQIGCYVPAESATIRVADRILARINLSDNMDYGASDFVLEMKEIQYFLTVMTKNSLIVIDELCRSTALREGTALAIVICEQLMKIPAFIFLTTHYKPITKLHDIYCNVQIWQMETLEVKNDQGKLIFTYNLIPGIVSLEHYGFNAAKLSWRENIVKLAESVLTKIGAGLKLLTLQAKKIPPQNRLTYNFKAEINILKLKKRLTPSRFNKKLLEFENNLKKLKITVRSQNSISEDVNNDIVIDQQTEYNVSINSEARFTHDSFQSLKPHSTATNSFKAPKMSFTFENVTSKTSSDSIIWRTNSIKRNVQLQAFLELDIQKDENCPISDSESYQVQQFSQPINDNSDKATFFRNPVTATNFNVFSSNKANEQNSIFTSNAIEFQCSLPVKSAKCEQNELQNISRIFSDSAEHHVIEDSFNNSLKSSDDSLYNSTQSQYKAMFLQPKDSHISFFKDTKPMFLKSSSVVSSKLKSNSKNDTKTIVCSQPDTFKTPSATSSHTNLKRANDSINLELNVSHKTNSEEKVECFTDFSDACDPDVSAAVGEISSWCEESFEEWDKAPTVQQKFNFKILSDVVIKPADVKLAVNNNQNSGSHILDEKEDSKCSLHPSSSIFYSPACSSVSKIENTKNVSVNDTEENENFQTPNQDIVEEKHSSLTNHSECFQSQRKDITVEKQLAFTYHSENLPSPNQGVAEEKLLSITDHLKNVQSPNQNVTEEKYLSITDHLENLHSPNQNVVKEEQPSLNENCKNVQTPNEDATNVLSNFKQNQTFGKLMGGKYKVPHQAPTTEKLKEPYRPLPGCSKSLSSSSENSCLPKTNKTLGIQRTVPLKRGTSTEIDGNRTGSSSNNSRQTRMKFKPPKRLTKRQIEDDFAEQNKKMREANIDPSEYVELLNKRPTVRQLQQTEHIALIKRTSEGIVVLSPELPRKRKLKFTAPAHSKSNFDTTLFSDKNSQKFEDLMASKNKNSQSGTQSHSSSNSRMYYCHATRNNTADKSTPIIKYSNDLESMYDEIKGDFSSQKRNSFCNKSKSDSSLDKSLTPDGFYKQNKTEITNIINKYLIKTPLKKCNSFPEPLKNKREPADFAGSFFSNSTIKLGVFDKTTSN